MCLGEDGSLEENNVVEDVGEVRQSPNVSLAIKCTTSERYSRGTRTKAFLSVWIEIGVQDHQG